MAEAFDFINSISRGKPERFTDMTGYVPFLTGRAMAQHMDTILLGNEVNKLPQLATEMHYGFLYATVSKKFRSGKWAKKDAVPEDVMTVSKFYQVSYEKATEYLEILTTDDVLKLKTMMDARAGGAGKMEKADQDSTNVY